MPTVHRCDQPSAAAVTDVCTWMGVAFVVADVPLPSCPIPPMPQHHSDASDCPAQRVPPCPLSRRVHVVAEPTCTGDERSDVVPSPTWPFQFAPQHHNVPAVLTAQVV